MGVHPREVLKQLMQMNGNPEEGEDELVDEGEEDPYGQEEDEEDFEDQQAREDRLRREKELFKQQMLAGGPSDKKPQPAQGRAPAEPRQPPAQQHQYY